MINTFNLFIIPFSIKDLIDILLVSILLYQLYKILKGTVAVNIFIGVISIYLIGLLVDTLEMKLLSTIIRQFIGVGGIALIILFQQEIRKFLVVIGLKSWNSNQVNFFKRLFPSHKNTEKKEMDFTPILNAINNLTKTKTGALMVITNQHDLSFYINTGDKLLAKLSSRLIESIFCKESPLHDGAVIISEDKIIAARCVLPVSDNENFPAKFGMRHRAAAGITETTDCIAILVSEESGDIGYAKNGKLKSGISKEELIKFLARDTR